MTRDRSNRRGVTLIEMMVAMALTLVVMLILVEAFKSATDFVRSANSTGNMMSQLNGAGTIMKRDMNAEHFLPDDTKPNGGVHLSDQRLDWRGGAGTKTWTAPRGGFFRIEAPRPAAAEAYDQDGFAMYTAVNHRLHFTAILTGGNEQNLFTNRFGPNAYSSRAAEVAYFLSASTGTTGGRNLYNLVRRYRLVALDNEVTNLTPAIGDDPTHHREMLSVPVPNPTNTVNTLATVQLPANRLSPLDQILPTNPRYYGEDILLSNVLSFEVTADWTPNRTAPPYSSTPESGHFTNQNNTDAPHDFLPGAGVFDTYNPAANMHARIKSIRVVIRVWDPRMKNGRQTTLVFDM